MNKQQAMAKLATLTGDAAITFQQKHWVLLYSGQRVASLSEWKEAKECRMLGFDYDMYCSWLYQAYADYHLPLKEEVYYRIPM